MFVLLHMYLTQFSFVQHSLDVISKGLFYSMSMCNIIRCFNMSSYSLRVDNASSDKSSNTINSADNTELATNLELYYLYDTGTALLIT